jgi:hypothetical protein
MRVLVGIAENAGDGHVRTADLLREVAVEILGGDDGDGLRLRRGGAETECEKDREKPAHAAPP